MTDRIKIRGLRRKPLDVVKLASALVQLAEYLEKKQAGDKKSPAKEAAHE